LSFFAYKRCLKPPPPFFSSLFCLAFIKPLRFFFLFSLSTCPKAGSAFFLFFFFLSFVKQRNCTKTPRSPHMFREVSGRNLFLLPSFGFNGSGFCFFLPWALLNQAISPPSFTRAGLFFEPSPKTEADSGLPPPLFFFFFFTPDWFQGREWP